MPVRVDDIVEALSSLGGEAHNSEITAAVKKIAPPPLPMDVEAVIRARLQERCAEAQSFKGGAVLFESVHGIKARAGVWRLISDPLSGNSADGFQDGVEPLIEAEEWRSQLRMHLRRERSAVLVKAFKAGLEKLDCSVCGFNFEEVYGELGAGFIEAHHIIPVAKLAQGQQTTINDLAPLCANCHRMAHRLPDLTLDDLKAMISGRPEKKVTRG